jgi:hypothetical protein
MPLEDRKGEAIHFSGGIYRGFSGWMDTEKTSTPSYHYVIVQKAGVLKGTKVKKENVEAPHRAPVNRAEAAFQQHPDLSEAMDKLVRKLAQCALHGDDVMVHYFKQKLDVAYGRQLSLGPKALWKEVEYSQEEEE